MKTALQQLQDAAEAFEKALDRCGAEGQRLRINVISHDVSTLDGGQRFIYEMDIRRAQETRLYPAGNPNGWRDV